MSESGKGKGGRLVSGADRFFPFWASVRLSGLSCIQSTTSTSPEGFTITTAGPRRQMGIFLPVQPISKGTQWLRFCCTPYEHQVLSLDWCPCNPVSSVHPYIQYRPPSSSHLVLIYTVRGRCTSYEVHTIYNITCHLISRIIVAPTRSSRRLVIGLG